MVMATTTEDHRVKRALAYVDGRRLPMACLPLAMGINDPELPAEEIPGLWELVDLIEASRKS